ncbi:MAG TPA: DUF2461 domain-containing protein [Pseudonocardiaceae bacterium]
MGFGGFGERLVDFYEGLEADNSKAYWTDHKPVYDEHVHAPMAALLADLEPELGRGKIFRPYRDLRFSKDKTPYKTHCGATVGHLYLEVGADGLLVAAGYYSPNPDQVERLRTAIDDDRRGADLEQRLKTLAQQGFERGGERLRTRPRGYDADHPRIELLRHKGLYGYRRWEPDDELHAPACLDRVRAAHVALRPLIEWLDDHVGPSTMPRR